MERKDFLKRGFGSLLGIAAISSCSQTSVDPTST
ncbi:MAG: intradiol ring-cleavage dioxygenase, partial [Cytophagaceae bacterium]